MFVGTGVSLISLFLCIRLGQNPYKMPTPILWNAIAGGVYVTGAMIYMFRIPERFMPGRFDIVGASHQIFHCFVLVGCGIYFWQNWLLLH